MAKSRDAAKERYWRGVIRRFGASGLGARRFCERERFVAGRGEERAGEDVVIEQGGLEREPTAEESCVTTATSTPPRTSKGRQKRILDASLPREKVLHPLDERNVPPELWNDPRAKRFFRFVREEVELQEARVRVLEHYEEVIVLDDEATGESRMLAASTPEPLIPRCYVGVASTPGKTHTASADARRIAILASTPGRKPYCSGQKTASKIGPITSSSAICATRSEIAGMPSGRWPPLLLGIHTRRRGFGQ